MGSGKRKLEVGSWKCGSGEPVEWLNTVGWRKYRLFSGEAMLKLEMCVIFLQIGGRLFVARVGNYSGGWVVILAPKVRLNKA